MATIRDQFSDQELDEIRAATLEAERVTGGELVCVIVQQCDSYESSTWKAAAFGAIGGSLAAGIWLSLVETWDPSLLPWILLPPILGAAVLLITIWAMPSLSRILVPQPVLDRRIDQRAAVAFLEEGIFDTHDRTGVLLFVALFEHGIRILCDTGVEARVKKESWEPIAAQLVAGLKRRRKGPAIAAAVRACGEVLVEHGVARRHDDENELSDEPRLFDA